MANRSAYQSLEILGIISACGGGDSPPLISALKAMQRRGYHITILYDAGTEKVVQAAGLSGICVPPRLDLAGFFNPVLNEILSTGKDIHRSTINPLEKWGEQCADALYPVLKKKKLSLILTSLLCIALGEKLANLMDVQWCFINPGFYFGDKDRRPDKEDFSYHGAQMYEHWVLPSVQKASLVLHATDFIFDRAPSTLPPTHFYTGPLFWEQQMDPPKGLDFQGAPWILISLSTAPQQCDLDIVHAAIGGLAGRKIVDIPNSKMRVLITIPGHNASTLKALSHHYSNHHPFQKIIFTGYIPHSTVLANCRLSISHAGHGTVMKSIFHGVPMVLIPWGRDQPGVASRAQGLGVASVVHRHKCNASSLAKAISDVLNSPKMAHRSKVESIRSQKINSTAIACRHLMNLISSK